MKSFFLTILLILLIIPVHGSIYSIKIKDSECDSLQTISSEVAYDGNLKQEEKIEKINSILDDLSATNKMKNYTCVLRTLTRYYFQNDMFIEALYEEHRIINYAKKFDFKNEIITSRNNLNILNYQLGNLDSALYYLNLNYNDLKSSDDVFAKGANLNGLIIYYNRNKNYEKAKSYLLQLQELAEREQNIELQKRVLINWMNYHKDIEEYEVAISYAEKYIRQHGETIIILNQLGLIYKLQEEYEKSLQIFYKLLEITPENNPYALAATNNNIGTVLNKLGLYNEALTYLEKGLTYSKEVKSIPFIDAALSELVLATKEEKNYKKSLKHTEELVALRDSTQSIELKERIANLETIAELNEKNTQIQLAEADKLIKEAELNQQKNLLLLSSFILIILIVFVVYILRLNSSLKQTKLDLEEANKTKDKFFSIIAHDLKSPIIALQGIGRRLTKHIKNDNFERVEKLSPELDRSLANVNFLLDNLLNWSVSHQGFITIKNEVVDVGDSIEESIASIQTMATSKNINITLVGSTFSVKTDENSLKLILRNLLSNAVKFSSEDSNVTVSLISSPTSRIEIIDKGKGISEVDMKKINQSIFFSGAKSQGEKGFGIGLILVFHFAKLNNIKIKIDSVENKGTKFSIEF